jgi:hypothetical protein
MSPSPRVTPIPPPKLASPAGRHKAQRESRGFAAPVSLQRRLVLHLRDSFALHPEVGPAVFFFCVPQPLYRQRSRLVRQMSLDCNTAPACTVARSVVCGRTRRTPPDAPPNCASKRTALPHAHDNACAARWTQGAAML